MQPYFPTFVYALPKRSKPLYLRRRGEDHYVTTLERGRVVYVGYNRVLGSTGPDARKLLRLVKKKKFRRVIVDMRLNPGGDNHTYVDLLRALRSKRVNKKGRLVVLIGRSTFSAAQNFITELERKTRAVFVGETSGGSPNLYGDVQPVDLPSAGLRRRHRRDLLAEELRRRPAGRDRAEDPVALSSKAFFAAGTRCSRQRSGTALPRRAAGAGRTAPLRGRSIRASPSQITGAGGDRRRGRAPGRP